MCYKIKILPLLILVLISVQSFAQLQVDKNNPILFIDRDYCISGDTLWFKVQIPNVNKKNGNIVHVQLNGRGNNLISNVIKKTEDGWASGFLNIPDSLSTGQYFLTAFQNSQLHSKKLILESKSLLVYNRFAEWISEIKLVESNIEQLKPVLSKSINIKTDKTVYQTREKVSVEINLDSDIKITSAVVKVSVQDPIAAEMNQNYNFDFRRSNNWIPGIREQDGFLISGKVLDGNGEIQKGVIVMLSIPHEPPYFDYFVSDENGAFHFLLKNAMGKTDMIIQAISQSQVEYFIDYELNSIEMKNEPLLDTKVLTVNQSESIQSRIKGNFIGKLFTGYTTQDTFYFDMPPRFSIPFYGQYTERVIPDDFLELPDFKEISRELLNGVQYRDKNDNVTIRMVSYTNGAFFHNEPLRLINGIPIFKNRLLTSLKSEDISYIDLVQENRVFGDLNFKGVLAVSLKDKSNSWLANQPNIFQFNIDCIQPEIKPLISQKQKIISTQPDLRQVFYWKKVELAKTQSISFMLSDLKGEVEISVEGISEDNQIVKTSKIIEVR